MSGRRSDRPTDNEFDIKYFGAVLFPRVFRRNADGIVLLFYLLNRIFFSVAFAVVDLRKERFHGAAAHLPKRLSYRRELGRGDLSGQCVIKARH